MLNEETNYTILSEEWRMTLRQVLRKGCLKGCTGLITLRLGFRDASVQKKKIWIPEMETSHLKICATIRLKAENYNEVSSGRAHNWTLHDIVQRN